MRDSAVVITGVGIASPLGSDFAAFSENLLAGKSVARPVTDERAGVTVRLPVCTADDPPVPTGWSHAKFHSLARSDQFVQWCCETALADADYGSQSATLRVGLVLGSGG